MGKKSRRREKKGQKLLKNEAQRKIEIDTIKAKLTNLGLAYMPGIDIFDKEAEKFIQSGDSWSGKIKIRGAKRILNVILTSNKQKESTATLLYNEHV